MAIGLVGIAGEVVVDLEGVADGADPGQGGGQGGGVHGKDPVGHHCHLVGDEHLFAQAHEKAGASGGEVRPGLPATVDLAGHGGVFHDGPGNKLGEEGDVEAQVQGGPLDLRFPGGHIQHVAEGLEGEEGDADGQLDNGDQKPKAQGVQGFHCEHQVFKDKEEGQIAPHRHGHRSGEITALALPGVDPPAEAVVHADGKKHHQQEGGLSPGVKEEGGRQQK